MLNDIVVTARRREEGAQTVPVSIAAFSAKALEERTVRSLGDLTALAPGIRFVHQGGGGNMNVVLRGLSRIPIGTAPNAVINYFADIPLDFNGSNLPTYDLANIQVLKGPQGTLFGRNAIAGAVVITPQPPTFDFTGYAKASYGNPDFKNIEAAINVPIVADKIALRVAGQISRRDGYTKNLGVGRDMDDVHQDMFRVSLLIEPNDTLRNTTVFDYFRADEGGTAAILVKLLPGNLLTGAGLAHPAGPLASLIPFFDCHTFNAATNPVPCAGFQPGRDIDDALAQQQAWGPRKTISDINQGLFRELYGVSNKTEFDLGRVTLRNIFGYRSTHVETDLNTDGVAFAPIPLINASSRIRTEQYSDEFHVFGKILDNRLDYLFGLLYIKEQSNGLNGFHFPVVAPSAPWVQAYTDKTNKAACAQIGYDLSNWVRGLKFNIGYRYNETRQTVCAITDIQRPVPATGIVGAEPTITADQCPTASVTGPTGIVVNGSTTSTKEHVSTDTIALDWRISPGAFTYVVHRKGYREGGVNTPAFTTPASAVLAAYQTYRPETLKDVEIGLKTDFRVNDVRGRFNIAAYRNWYSNVVTPFNTSALVPASDAGAPQSSSVGINMGKRTITGFETEFMLEPVRGLGITNTAAFTHQKITQASVPPVAGLQPPSFDPASPKYGGYCRSVRWTDRSSSTPAITGSEAIMSVTIICRPMTSPIFASTGSMSAAAA